MHKKVLAAVTVLLSSVSVFAGTFLGALEDSSSVKVPRFDYPLRKPMYFSGDYGELRPGHFHMGTDCRIGGVVGAPVYAPADGYISRISVSSSGYGNCLYINHNGGYTTVYGHLFKFRPDIARFVRDLEYKNHNFRVDTTLPPEKFPVKRGEQIANAGNTGSSGGPHLHYEIRLTRQQLSLNPFLHGFIKSYDKVPPVINKVFFYGYSDEFGAPQTFMIGDAAHYGHKTIEVPEFSYLAVDAVDKMAGNSAKFAVNEYKVLLDSILVYDFRLGDIPFSEGRYVNSLTEYSALEEFGRKMVKSYVEPGNKLRYKIDSRDKGLFHLKDTLRHEVRLEVFDYNGNMSSSRFFIRRNDSAFTDCLCRPHGQLMQWRFDNYFVQPGFLVYIPSRSFYKSVFFTADTADTRITPYSPVWNIFDKNVPLNKGVTVKMQYDGPKRLESKIVLAQVDDNGEIHSGTGSCEHGVVTAKIWSFGTYTLVSDTLAPLVVPSFKNGVSLRSNKISFKIKDDMSGIASFDVFIDGHWSLGILDGKTSQLNVLLKYARISRGRKHVLVIKVRDARGNETVLKRSFFW
ncbi:MAG: M23 family metallopeptidase [Bacteroidales bacterium]|nr:M23 family metallopeptidase [Bacteroidales bacterium]